MALKVFASRRARKAAFVLGNRAYASSEPLPNAERDAREIAGQLRALGFDVTLETNLSAAAHRTAFTRFVNRISSEKGVETVLLYFAGHGFQEAGRNYLLSVSSLDAPEEAISLQRMISDLKGIAERRLIFLDACRDYFNVEKVAKTLAQTRSATGPVPRIETGLAEFDYGNEVFIAYSAAPGGTALDSVGDAPLSPFATALARYVAELDLPLSTVMTRVRDEVAQVTQNAQLPWSSDGLRKPFFFNPGAHLILTGNLMALLAVVVSIAAMIVAAIEFGVDGLRAAVNLLLAGLVATTSVAILLFGVLRVQARLKGQGTKPLPTTDLHGETPIPPWHGAVGGLLGGIIGSPFVAIPYWWTWRSTDSLGCTQFDLFDASASDRCPRIADIVVESMLAGIFITGLLGALTVAGANLVLHSDRRWTQRLGPDGRIVAGAVLGGTAAGLVLGPLITAWFGSLDRPFLDPSFIMVFAALTIAVAAVSINSYSLERFSMARMQRSFLGALVSMTLSIILLGPAIFLLATTGLIETIYLWAKRGFYDDAFGTARKYGFLLAAGLPYGLVFGPCLGFLIGVARVLGEPWTDLTFWSRRDALTRRR